MRLGLGRASRQEGRMGDDGTGDRDCPLSLEMSGGGRGPVLILGPLAEAVASGLTNVVATAQATCHAVSRGNAPSRAENLPHRERQPCLPTLPVLRACKLSGQLTSSNQRPKPCPLLCREEPPPAILYALVRSQRLRLLFPATACEREPEDRAFRQAPGERIPAHGAFRKVGARDRLPAALRVAERT